jgi:hypothetical protein
VRAGRAAPQWLAIFNTNAAFRICDFDQRAAIQVALMAQEAGDRARNPQDTYAKIKYDRQIAAIAKVQGASAVYSDDANVRNYARRLGMAAVALADLPLPPPPQVTGPDLLSMLESTPGGTTPEEDPPSGIAEDPPLSGEGGTPETDEADGNA